MGPFAPGDSCRASVRSGPPRLGRSSAHDTDPGAGRSCSTRRYPWWHAGGTQEFGVCGVVAPDDGTARTSGPRRPVVTAARSVSIVFPALNEEECIEHSVKEALACGARLSVAGAVDRFEVVVVDDGSTDRTAEILASLSSEHENLVVVHHPRNRGLGAAVRSALAGASCDLVFYTDADLPVDLTMVDESIAFLDRNPTVDVVSLYRLDRGGEGIRRHVYSIVYNALIRFVLRVRVRDVNFAAKLVRSSVLEGLRLESEGSFIDAELLARLERRGHRVAQLPAAYHPRSVGVSTLSSIAVIRTMLREMRFLTPRIRRERPT